MNYEGIKSYLLQHPDWFHAKSNKATSWQDFERWPNTSVDRNHLIMPGEYFMVDPTVAEAGSFWIVQLLRTGEMRLVFQITDDMRRDFGDVLNGYWIVPEPGEEANHGN
jgi:hypothetical protein